MGADQSTRAGLSDVLDAQRHGHPLDDLAPCASVADVLALQRAADLGCHVPERRDFGRVTGDDLEDVEAIVGGDDVGYLADRPAKDLRVLEQRQPERRAELVGPGVQFLDQRQVLGGERGRQPGQLACADSLVCIQQQGDGQQRRTAA